MPHGPERCKADRLQLFLVAQKGTNDDTVDNLRWYNLFGDPSLLIRTDLPKALNIERGRSKKSHGNFQIRVTSNGAPIEGAVASVVRNDGRVTSSKTSKDGTAVLPFATRLVVSGYNLQTSETPLY